MCVEHQTVAVSCGHPFRSRKEFCSAAPCDYPNRTCENTRVFMTFSPQFCDHCLDLRSRTEGFGGAFSSLCSKRALNSYWKALAELNSWGAVKTPKPRDGDASLRGFDQAAYSHWITTMKLFITEARPLTIAVGERSFRRLDWAAGSPELDIHTVIAYEAIEEALRMTPDSEDNLDKICKHKTEDKLELTFEEMYESMREEIMVSMHPDDSFWGYVS